MPKFPVIRQINHDGKLYSTGSEVELPTYADAKPLIEAGVLGDIGEKVEEPIAIAPQQIADAVVRPAEPSFLATPESTRAQREAELKQLFENNGWQAIKAVAEPLGLTKPPTGWDAAIPAILDKEFPVAQ